MRGRINTLAHQQLIYGSYLDSNSERFIALYSEAAKFRIRISSMCLF